MLSRRRQRVGRRRNYASRSPGTSCRSTGRSYPRRRVYRAAPTVEVRSTAAPTAARQGAPSWLAGEICKPRRGNPPWRVHETPVTMRRIELTELSRHRGSQGTPPGLPARRGSGMEEGITPLAQAGLQWVGAQTYGRGRWTVGVVSADLEPWRVERRFALHRRARVHGQGPLPGPSPR